MLGESEIEPTIGVRDLEVASKFYTNTLGLQVAKENPYEITYKTGRGTLSLYKTRFSGTNKATYATWNLEDLDKAVASLEDKGVTFEHYDGIEGMDRDGDIHTMGTDRAAWFKDPDGNILCLHQTV